MPKCKFCGSEDMNPETGYVDAFGEKLRTPCCEASKRNTEYIRKNYDPSRSEKIPTLDEVSDGTKL